MTVFPRIHQFSCSAPETGKSLHKGRCALVHHFQSPEEKSSAEILDLFSQAMDSIFRPQKECDSVLDMQNLIMRTIAGRAENPHSFDPARKEWLRFLAAGEG